MDIIFGLLRHDGAVSEAEVLALASGTASYVSDGTLTVASGPVGMGRQFVKTNATDPGSPRFDSGTNLLAFDGRLDNVVVLGELLGLPSDNLSASEVVLAAFARWRGDCFSRLVGDWAIALWSGPERALYLARDHAGTRTLFFEQERERIQWSSCLESFSVSTVSRGVNDPFLISLIAGHPKMDLTPYETIQAVLPGQYVRFDQKGRESREHWRCWPRGLLSYQTGAEYEEHFFRLFKQSVARRTQPPTDSIMAQLSGGMDSTSIVCMSDHIRSEASDRAVGLIDTISYYSESEPDWNEQPYFSVTEKRRGKVGIHVCAAPAEIDLDSPLHWPLYPGSTNAMVARERQLNDAVAGHAYRVVLSGIGGDELLGGVPTPLPELADYLGRGKWKTLFLQTLSWCTYGRTPLPFMFWDVVRFLRSLYFDPTMGASASPSWLRREAQRIDRTQVKLHSKYCRSYSQSPAAVSNAVGWWSLLETLPHLFPSTIKRYEYRYPFLDRDLVDFLLQVPRVQLIEPGRRRTLMRRAMASIVPTEVLERRRKAFLSRRTIRAIQAKHESVRKYFGSSILADRGLIDRTKFLEALDQAASGDNQWSRQVCSTIDCEVWLRRVESVHRV